MQAQRPGRLASVSEEEEPPLAKEDAVRHWLQYGRPPGTRGVAEPQVPPSEVSRESALTTQICYVVLMHDSSLTTC